MELVEDEVEDFLKGVVSCSPLTESYVVPIHFLWWLNPIGKFCVLYKIPRARKSGDRPISTLKQQNHVPYLLLMVDCTS